MKTSHIFRNTLIVAGGVLVPSVLLAGNVTINTFTSGTPIQSAQVNANFNALADGLNTHNHFSQHWTGSDPNHALEVSNTNANAGDGFYAENNAPSGLGVSATVYTAIHGRSNAAMNGVGVIGDATSTTGGVGVFGASGGVGVQGFTLAAGSTAVYAAYGSNDGKGTALNVEGAIRVSGGTPAAFRVTAIAGKSCFAINNVLTNGDPNAILLVTPLVSTQKLGAPNVQYDGNAWEICSSGMAFYGVEQFNVLVVKQG
jgi:hypothetical protein